MRPEVANYLRRCRAPAFALAAAGRLTARVWWSIMFRLLPRTRHLAQPRQVKRIRRTFLALGAEPLADALAVGDTAPLPSRALTLTIGETRIERPADWRRTFPDIEETVALQRWNWLLRGITDDAEPLNRYDGLALMRSWIAECLGDERFAFEAYTTGERIANGSLFLRRTGDGSIPADIAAAFRLMARQVAQHLEYYPAGQTGNHAFNNARALLYAGVHAGMPQAVELACAIADERIGRLVTTDGFMREGSSHYHLLFTRWVLEMCWLAREAGAASLEALLAPHAARLVERCWFFLVRDEAGQWSIPLVGDVSPDVPPEWLLGLPWSAIAREYHDAGATPPAPTSPGWATLFGVRGDGGTASAAEGLFTQSGWCRAQRGEWTLFVRACSTDGSAVAGHEHDDLGSFVLFRRGRPLLVDPGRFDYTGGPLSRYGRSARAHNTLLVEGMGPAAGGSTWMAPRYAAVEATLTQRTDEDAIVVMVEHDGFGRLANGAVRHRRVLRLSASGLAIEDQLDGTGTREVSLLLHFAPAVAPRDDDGMRWGWGGDAGMAVRHDPRLTRTVGTAGRHGVPDGLYFPAYGRQERTHAIELRAWLTLPTSVNLALKDDPS